MGRKLADAECFSREDFARKRQGSSKIYAIDGSPAAG